MAEDKDSKSSKGSPETDLLTIAFGLIFLGLLILPYLKNATEEVANSNEELSYQSDFNNIIPIGNLKINQTIKNRKEAEIRQSPGGAIIGTQPIYEKGTLAEGPVTAFDYVWWRVDYKEAPDGWVNSDNLTRHTILLTLLNGPAIIYARWVSIATFISILFVLVIIYILFKKSQLRRIGKDVLRQTKNEEKKKQLTFAMSEETEEENKKDDSINLLFQKPQEPEKPKNPKWQNVLMLVSSNNAADWRQAIIEADIMLDLMLSKIGYKGESVAEKLKQIEASDFLTLNSAWEAHKVRNRIAHMGSDFVLPRNEAQRVIDLYKEVFEEFYYI